MPYSPERAHNEKVYLKLATRHLGVLSLAEETGISKTAELAAVLSVLVNKKDQKDVKYEDWKNSALNQVAESLLVLVLNNLVDTHPYLSSIFYAEDENAAWEAREIELFNRKSGVSRRLMKHYGLRLTAHEVFTHIGQSYRDFLENTPALLEISSENATGYLGLLHDAFNYRIVHTTPTLKIEGATQRFTVVVYPHFDFAGAHQVEVEAYATFRRPRVNNPNVTNSSPSYDIYMAGRAVKQAAFGAYDFTTGLDKQAADGFPGRRPLELSFIVNPGFNLDNFEDFTIVATNHQTGEKMKTVIYSDQIEVKDTTQ